ncbi:hypothetical protein [Aquimarina sp. 2201CG5-10]|uniref:beta strand repeat-containing protein n=1 Tax=Aquimarina callyspongiae TaxID=3098150 RepID=UPI002AB3E2E5|nr:hypothetical protein [Aquimarina sp. 2201CG5-10]MDY8134568.1 hypothetical protein [Aquimarina sp. 2201CG5-10]
MKILKFFSVLYIFSFISISSWGFQNIENSSVLESQITAIKIKPVNDGINLEVDSSGNLVYTDFMDVNDDISIISEDLNYRVSNSSALLVAGKGMKQDGNDVLIPITLVTGEIKINTQGGDDTFTIDLSNGDIGVPINYSGGAQNTPSGDDLILISSDAIVYDTVVHTFINDHDGYVEVSGNNTINYTGLEPITDNLNTSDRVFTFTGDIGNIETINLEAGGTLDNRIDSSLGESVDFNNPLNSLSINLSGAGEDLFSVRSLANGFDASLTINGDTGDDVGFRNNAIDLGNGNLNITCDLLSIHQNITTTGTINTSSKNTTHIINATVQSNGGNISVSSGTEVVSGDYGVINMFGGHVETTGSGTIAMNGRAYSSRNINFILSGIFMRNGSSITTDTGTLEMTGSGVFDGRANIRGIRIEGNSSIQSTTGNITITGTGMNGANNDNVGVSLASGAIQTGGTLNITGTGYIGMQLGGIVKDSGNMSLQGTSASANTPAINITSSNAKLDSNNLLIRANVGPINTPNGVALQELIEANNTTINGVLAPGQSPGQLIANTNLTIGSGSTVEIEFESSSTAGSDYDQIVVRGAIDITGTTFNLVDNANAIFNENYTIIDNDGTDPVLGTFDGLPNGAAIAGNGRTWNIYYNYDGNNDVVLVTEPDEPNVYVDNSGNMVFEDSNGLNNNLRIRVDGVNYRISDSENSLISGFGAIQDGNDILIPITSVTGEINLNAEAGDDTLNIDLSNGNFTDVINFNGNNGADKLSLLGTGTYNNVVHTVDNPGEGKVRVTGNSMINYTGVEGNIIDQLDVNERTFTINADTTTSLKSDGTLENQVDIRGFLTIDYNNPNNVLTINGTGGENGFIQVTGFASGFDAHLVIIKEEDVVRLGPNTNINLGSGILRVIARSVLFRTEVTTQGAIEVTSYEGTSFSEANVVSSDGEDITINAGLFPNPGLSTYGIDMIESTLRTTGAGNITLSGKAFSDDPSISTRGITMVRTNILTDSGTITITGKGPVMGVNQCKGVIIGLETVIQSNSGNINITGTGGECSGGVNVGVSLVIDMMIKTSGSGHINIDGNSGLAGDYNYGIEMMGTSSITAENGEVIFMGNSTATTGTGHIGIWLEGAVSTTGTGNITVNGRVNSSDNTIGIFLPEHDTQIQSGNNLHLYAVSGPIYTPEGPARQDLFSANNIFINGALEPGRSSGQLMINGVLEANVGTTLEIEIDDFTTAGVHYDQIVVNGTVNLEDATLTIKDNSGSFSSPKNLILINNDGDDPITGTFFGLPHGTAIPGNQKTWYIYYNLNGNDVLLSTSPPNVHVDNSGNLVFSDPYAVNDNLKITVDGENYRINDSEKPVIAGVGATQDGNEVLVAITSVTGAININTEDGDDMLNIDLSNGNFTDAVNFEGGNDNDGLSVTGTGIYDSDAHTVSSAGEGTIAITGNSAISYTGLEQTITDHLEVNERIFTINVNNFTILEAVGALENQVRISDITTIDYNNPNTALTINGAGSDVGYVYINGFATGFDANLTVVREEDQVRFGDIINTDLGSGALNVTSKIVIFRTDVTTEGPINITADEAIHMSGSVVQSTAGEDITMKSGIAPQPGTGFDGFEAFECTIQTFGTGNIILDGKAYTENTSTFLEGMTLYETNIITDIGDITISGTGPATGPLKSIGMQVLFSSEIQSNSGNISITGIGGNSIGASNIGTAIESSIVRTADAGSITINGTGGMGTEFNYGVDIKDNATILAYDGNITITGTSLDTTGNNPFGINFNASATTLAGTGNIILEGTSGRANASAINISYTGTELQSGGDLIMTTNLGPMHTTDGVTGVQTNFVAENNIVINGVLAPGQSIGQMITLGNLTMQSDDTLEVEINNFTTAGTDYDQIVVREGSVDITGTTLTLIDNSGILSENTETLVLIDNDGTDPIIGTFDGLPNGASIAGNNKIWYIYYNRGDGNDVILSSDLLSPNVFVDASGNMVFTDPYQLNDQLTIIIDGRNYRISDQTRGLIAGAGAIQDGNDVLVAISSVTGAININTEDGNDHLNIDLNGGDFTDEINFDGGNQADGLSLLGTGTYTNVTHTFTDNNEDEGLVAITENSTITYRSIEETIVDNLNVNNRIFALDLDNNVTLDNIGSLDNQIYASKGIVVDYKKPSNSLTINKIGLSDNTLFVRGVKEGFDADFTINANNDDVRFDSNKTIDIGSGNLHINSGTLTFGSNSHITTRESIVVNTKSVTSILGRVYSDGGNISVMGGTEVIPKDNYSGIFLYSCHIETTGAGSITLDGTAYFNTASDIVLDGILMRRNSRIITDTGDIILLGKGVDNGLVNYRGVYIEESSSIESRRGHIAITGTARDHDDDSNIGVFMEEGTKIETDKPATLNITGEGKVGMELNGLISTGNVSLEGTSRSVDAPAINLVSSTAKVQGFRDVTLTTNVGTIHTPSGVATQTHIDAITGITTINGVLAPGQSSGSEIGQLVADGDFVMQSDDTLEIDLNNFNNAGEGYDQLVVNGGFVDINETTLVLKDDTGMLLPGQSVTLVLIDNDGTYDKAIGTFKGLPNGAAITGNGKTWYIYYNLGDDNDVVLSTENIEVIVKPRVYLQGAAFDPNTGEEALMRDDLRIEGHIPLTSPYEDEVIVDASVFSISGNDAIVDWVWVELRDKDDNTKILYSQSALLQRDGDVVAFDGVSNLSFKGVISDNYYVAIKHRNHLGILSANTINLNNDITTVDFSNGNMPTYGTNALTVTGMPVDILGMWAGDANGDGIVRYSGDVSDNPDILSYVLNDPDNFLNLPTYQISGYTGNDININGTTQYVGGNSDLPFILQNVMNHPDNSLNLSTWTIQEQLPESMD